MSEQTFGLNSGEDVDEEVGSNGHSSHVFTAVEFEINNEIPCLSKRRAPADKDLSKLSLSMCSSSPCGYGLRRAFAIGRRGSPSTPVPGWKVLDNSILAAHHRHHRSRHLNHGYAEQGPPISARKLAACLWELENLPFGQETRVEEYGGSDTLQMNNTAGPTKHMLSLHGEHLSPACSRISRRLLKRLPIRMKQSTDSGKMHSRIKRWTGQQATPLPNALIQENIDDSNTITCPSVIAVLNSSKDASSSMDRGHTNADELWKVLNHVATLEKQHASSMSLVHTLRSELEDAQSQLRELLLNEKSHREDIDNISRRIAEQRSQWEDQQQQTIKVAVHSARQELQNERKSKQKLETLHRKMAREFRGAQKTIARVSEDLERERKARKLMEEVCDELAREIGEDKARVEELQRESVKVKEETEEERKMLQMAEVWREERVQMKLMEAKVELEEKNTKLDTIRSQLEAVLRAKRAGDLKDGGDDDATGYLTRLDAEGRHSVELVLGRRLSDPFHLRQKRCPNVGRKSVDSCRSKQTCWTSDSDVDDDLHSIELNPIALVSSRTASSNQWGSSHSSVQNDDTGYQEKWSSDEKVMLAENRSEFGGEIGDQRSNLSDRREPI